MALEATYDSLLAEMEAKLDPVCGDAWPRHRMASGASLAARLSCYRQIGGLPRIPVDEDRALLAELRAVDARIRHSQIVRLTTSCRLQGRAVGGAADTLRQRVEQSILPCDTALEPAMLAAHRWRARGMLRRLHAADDRPGLVR